MIKVCNDGHFDLYFSGKYYGCVKVESIPDFPERGSFHINIVRFTHNILNRMLRDEECLMKYIKQLGYDELISVVNTQKIKEGSVNLWMKFVSIFNFDEPKLITGRKL